MENSKKSQEMKNSKRLWVDLYSEDDEEEEALKHILAAFLVNDSLTEHVFPVTLSSRQRYLVHEVRSPVTLPTSLSSTCVLRDIS